MKIVYIYSSITHIAGTERILVDKMNYLSECLNQDVILITYEQNNLPYSFPISTKVKHISLDIKFYSVYKYKYPRLFIEKIRINKKFKTQISQTIKDISPDVIICTSYLPREIRLIANLKTNAVKIIESHVPQNYLWQTKNKNVLYRLYNYYHLHRIHNNIKKLDAAVALTKEDCALWGKYMQSFVLPDLITYYPNENSTCLNKRVIAAGRFVEQKGFDILIEAWDIVNKKHSDWILDIYNSNTESYTYRKMLSELIKNKYLGNNVFLHNAASNIYEKYLNSSIYVLSSRFEGFALVLIEAMSCGVPCIAFDCPHGPRDIIKNGEDGILVKEINSSLLAEQICYLIENESTRIEMGKKARENVKRYRKEVVMPQWIELFEKLMDGKTKNTKK